MGVEWDDATRGKHDGSTGGVQYFSCVSGTISGSFVRLEKVRYDGRRMVPHSPYDRALRCMAEPGEGGTDTVPRMGIIVPTSAHETGAWEV